MSEPVVIPVWAVLPFAVYLLAIAVLPLLAPHLWERNRNKLLLAGLFSLPVVGYLAFGVGPGLHWLAASLEEYVAFIVLLASLYVISGGIYLRGSLCGTPLTNTGFLAIGALFASFIGTTGASMLLIRPLLRANEKRSRKAHIVVFFIFVVANAGGMLTPLGDPPLYLGFLRGVDFLWTLRLWKVWALVNGVLLVLFNVLDQYILDREERERDEAVLDEVQHVPERLAVEGKLNLLWLLGVVVVIFAIGRYGNRITQHESLLKLMQVVGMLAMAGLSLATTSAAVHRANRFGWGPILEVAAIFSGVFVTMVPALRLLEAWGESGRIAISHPWQFFWASGMLSSVLDNAPTYLTFASLASGVESQLHHVTLSAAHLDGMLQFPHGEALLVAVSCGAVLMGANTYIGNGPNFMVKAIADEAGVKMPSFFGYMLWSGAILIPLFGVVTLVFFR